MDFIPTWDIEFGITLKIMVTENPASPRNVFQFTTEETDGSSLGFRNPAASIM